MALCDLYGRMGAAPQALIGIRGQSQCVSQAAHTARHMCLQRAFISLPTVRDKYLRPLIGKPMPLVIGSSVHVNDRWARFHRLRPRSDVFESLPSITIDCYHIEGIDAEVEAIDMVFIERKGYRTRDHSAANVYLAAVRDDEHAGQTARQIRPNLTDLKLTDRLSRR